MATAELIAADQPSTCPVNVEIGLLRDGSWLTHAYRSRKAESADVIDLKGAASRLSTGVGPECDSQRRDSAYFPGRARS